MAKVFAALTVTAVLLAANALSIAETGNAPEPLESTGKADRLEVSTSVKTDVMVLEQREMGLSKLYLADSGKMGCSSAIPRQTAEAIGL